MTRWLPLLLLCACADTKDAEDDAAPVDTDRPVDPGPFEPQVPTLDLQTRTFEDFDVVQAIPDDPAGLVFAFHGAGGTANWIDRVEVTEVLNALFALDLGVVSTDSTDRGEQARWDIEHIRPEDNVDLSRLQRLWQDLVDSGDIDEDTPLFTLGMSNGGSMATTVAHAWNRLGAPVRAAAPYGGAVPDIVRTTRGPVVPTFAVFMQHDHRVDNDRHQGFLNEAAAEGTRVEIHTSTEFDLVADRFLRLPGVTDDQADRIFQAVVDNGFVDADGVRQIDPEDAPSVVDTLQLPDDLAFRRAGSSAQISVAWALHEFTGRYTAEHAAFFADEL